jgi:REP element-mobilizing transposase RayT
MPRPLRIEYENAYYHVMNRGRARQTIFHDDDYFEAFLTTLSEAHQRFGVEVLCYCLMKNHYHLLLKTPEANLGRVMRHINGVYTQRHNRLKKTDGPLFRGRYKAICVEADSYQLQLSRYIHRNPLEAKLVEELDSYAWSSYQYYVRTTAKPPTWLYRSEVYNQLSVKSRLQDHYRAYVERGVDEEIKQFYAKDHVQPYLGSDAFRAWVYSQRMTDDEAVIRQERAAFRPSMDEVIERVASVFDVSRASIVRTSRRGTNNIPRWVAMYLCQAVCGCRLVEIAAYFGLKRTGSIPTTISKLKHLMNNDKALMSLVNNLQREGL